MSCRKGRVIYPSPLIMGPLPLQHSVLGLEGINEKKPLGPRTGTPPTDGNIWTGSLKLSMNRMILTFLKKIEPFESSKYSKRLIKINEKSACCNYINCI